MPQIDPLEATRQFWNASPCGAQGTFLQRLAFRLQMGPWVPMLLKSIASRHEHILEVGCGPGLDGLLLAHFMPRGKYIGIDYSSESIAQAQANLQQVAALDRQAFDAVISPYIDSGIPAMTDTSRILPAVEPVFQVGNAEQLDFPDNTFDAVYSMGVIHHTANDRKAFSEVFRVLRPNGTAYIALYRKPSLKVGIAQALRAVQAMLDRILGTEKCLYQCIKDHNLPFGTMLLECFGVPIMRWYNKKELQRIFSDFEIVDMRPIGHNIPMITKVPLHRTPYGYYWYCTIRKPVA